MKKNTFPLEKKHTPHMFQSIHSMKIPELRRKREERRLCGKNDVIRGPESIIYCYELYMNKLRGYYEEGLSLSENQNDIKAKANFLNKIGSLYMEQEFYRKSLKYFEEAIEDFSILGDLEGRAEVLHSIGLIYKKYGYS